MTNEQVMSFLCSAEREFHYQIGSCKVWIVKIRILDELDAVYCLSTGKVAPKNMSSNMELIGYVARDKYPLIFGLLVLMAPIKHCNPADGTEWSLETMNEQLQNAVQEAAKKLPCELDCQEYEYDIYEEALRILLGKKRPEPCSEQIVSFTNLDDEAFANAMLALPDYKAAAQAWLSVERNRKHAVIEHLIATEAEKLAQAWKTDRACPISKMATIMGAIDGKKTVKVGLQNSDESITADIPTVAFNMSVRRIAGKVCVEFFVSKYQMTSTTRKTVEQLMNGRDISVDNISKICYRGKTIWYQH